MGCNKKFEVECNSTEKICDTCHKENTEHVTGTYIDRKLIAKVKKEAKGRKCIVCDGHIPVAALYKSVQKLCSEKCIKIRQRVLREYWAELQRKQQLKMKKETKK